MNTNKDLEESLVPFSTLGELRCEHLELLKSLRIDRDSSLPSKRVNNFVCRASLTGSRLEGAAERNDAQDILDYWRVRLLSVNPYDDIALKFGMLQPFRGVVTDSCLSEAVGSRIVPEKAISAKEHARLNALARQWRDSNKDPGYLIEGDALSTAILFSESDPEIANLVGASEAALRKKEKIKRRYWRFLAYSLFIVVLFVSALAGFALKKSRLAEDALNRLNIIYDLLEIKKAQIAIYEQTQQLSSLQEYIPTLEKSKDSNENNAALKAQIDRQLDQNAKEIADYETNIRGLRSEEETIISRIGQANDELWSGLSYKEKAEVIERILKRLSGERSLNSESTLRLALYAISAVPIASTDLDNSLRDSIQNYRVLEKVSPPDSQQIWGIAFRPDGKQVAFGTEKGVIWLLNDPGSGGAHLISLGEFDRGLVNGVAYNGDGSLLAAAYRDLGAVVIDPANRQILCSLLPKGSRGEAFSVAFAGGSYGDRQILAVGTGSGIEIWRISGKRCGRVPFRGSLGDKVFGLTFSLDGTLLAAASADGFLRIWSGDIKGGEYSPVLYHRIHVGKPLFAVAVSPAGDRIVASTADGTGLVWATGSLEKAPLKLQPQGGQVGQVAFSRDGKFVVATATAKGGVIVSDPTNGEVKYRFDDSGSPIFGVAFSPRHDFLATGALDGTMRVWQVGGDEVLDSSRPSLLKLGFERLKHLSLTAEECRILRRMGIPIFEMQEMRERAFAPLTSTVSCDLALIRTSFRP